MKQTNQLTVYYDGACPLCAKEIGWYQKQQGADEITWLDVSQSTEERVSSDLCTTDALRRFHVRKIDGSIVSGASAFSALWLKLPRFKLLGKIVGLPGLSSFAEIAYRFFLLIRPWIQRLFR